MIPLLIIVENSNCIFTPFKKGAGGFEGEPRNPCFLFIRHLNRIHFLEAARKFISTTTAFTFVMF